MMQERIIKTILETIATKNVVQAIKLSSTMIPGLIYYNGLACIESKDFAIEKKSFTCYACKTVKHEYKILPDPYTSNQCQQHFGWYAFITGNLFKPMCKQEQLYCTNLYL
jgi:hypothetical protein